MMRSKLYVKDLSPEEVKHFREVLRAEDWNATVQRRNNGESFKVYRSGHDAEGEFFEVELIRR